MPIQLVDFLKEKGGQGSPDEMIASLECYPPGNTSSMASIHFSPHYKSLIEEKETWMLARFMQAIGEMLLSPISLQILPLDKSEFIKFWNMVPTKREHAEAIYTICAASLFQFQKVGNCSARAAFSAIELFKRLNKTETLVYLKSSSKIDQFVVYLGNKSDGWMVYDPLTNPRLIFPLKEYQREVLSCFKEVEKKAQPVQFKIKPAFIHQFSHQKKKINDFLIEAINTMSVDTLNSNMDYMVSIMKIGMEIGLPYEKTEKLTKKAYSEMKKFNNATLDKFSCGLDRDYPRYCPNFSLEHVTEIIEEYLSKAYRKSVK